MPESLDTDRIARTFRDWLATRSGASDLELTRFEVPGHGGMSHETFICEVANGGDLPRGLVLRLEPSGPPLFPRYDLDAQCRVMETLAENSDVPVPRVLWKESGDDVFGRPFYVMERVEGRVPSDVPPFLTGGWLRAARPEQQARAQESLVAALARLHALDWQRMGLGFVARSQPGATPLDRELAFWREYLAWACDGAPLPRLGEVLDWCESHRPVEPAPAVFNWGDARYGNVVYGADYAPAAILDWEMAHLGPAGLDLGWLLFTHGTALMWFDDLPGFRDRDGVVALYEACAGRTVEDLGFYEVWAGLRVAAIRVRQIEQAWLLGRSDDRAARERNPLVASLERALALADAA